MSTTTIFARRIAALRLELGKDGEPRKKDRGQVTTLERRRMRRMRATGMSLGEIARRLGRDPRTVAGHVRGVRVGGRT